MPKDRSKEVLFPSVADRQVDQSGSWAMFDAILQGSPVATFVIDADFKVSHWNRACEIITGILALQVIGTSDQWKGFYPAPRPVLADLIVAGELEQALANYEAGHCHRSAIVAGAYEAEGFFPQAAGEGRWLYFTAAPLCDAEGRVVGAIETLQDITERKLAQQALQDQHDNLEKLVASRTAELLATQATLENDIERRQVVENELRERNVELLELTQARSELEERVSFASSTAMTAMSSMGEMGVLLQALQRYNVCRSVGELLEAVIATMASYDLTGVVQIRTAEGRVEASTRGETSPHDAAVFSRLSSMGRIVHFHSRMIINYERVSLLIHNVPKEDAEKVGRIRDNLAILVEAADVRLAALLAEQGFASRQAAIVSTMEQMRQVLSGIERRQNDSLSASTLAIEQMVSNLEKLFVHLGLSTRQEEMLLDLINASIEQISGAQSGQLDFQQELSGIIQKLEAFSKL